MNLVCIIGRLTKDPDFRHQGGNATDICKFTLAVDRRGEDADFISCVAFGRTAEFVSRHFKKGQKMALTGRIQTGSYTNNEGRKVYTTDVIADNVEFCEKKDDTPAASKNEDGFVQVSLDDPGLPFN